MRSAPIRCVGVLVAGLIGLAGRAGADPKKRRADPPPVPTAPAPRSADAPADEPASPAAPPAARPSGTRPVVTVHVYEEDAPEAPADAIVEAFGAQLAKDDRLFYVDLADLLDPSADARAALAQADQSLRDAQAAFDQMDLETARGKVDRAIKVYERHLPLLGRDEGGLRRARDAWIRLAAVRFFDGNNDGARDALRHALVFDPHLDYSPKLFPPQMRKSVIEGRLLFDALGTGKVAVTTEPPGAQVYLNGVAHGTSPVTIPGATAGPNVVSVTRRGFVPSATVVEVAGGGDETSADLALARFDRDPLVPLGKARQLLGAAAAPAVIGDASRRLGAPLLALVRLKADGGSLQMTAYLYDARSMMLLRKSARGGPADRAADTARTLAIDLFTGVRLDGKVVAPEEDQGPGFFARLGERWTAFRGSGAFWPTVAVAGAVALVGAVVGIGAAAAAAEQQRAAATRLVLFGF